MERTLLNIKPDAVGRNLTGEILRRVEEAGFRIVLLQKVWLSRREAEAFYTVHQDKPFFDGLVDFISSGPCVPCVIEGENAVKGIRKLIGATDPAEAEEGTIRRDFASSTQQNCVHASDGPDTAGEEIGFFFAGRQLILTK